MENSRKKFTTLQKFRLDKLLSLGAKEKYPLAAAQC
jgi:hypothetical protein